MALEFADPFDAYATADIETWWTQLYQQSSTSGTPTTTIGAFGRRGTNGLRFAITSVQEATEPAAIVIGPRTGVGVLGFAFQPTGDGSFVTNRLGTNQAPWVGVATLGANGRNVIAAIRSLNVTQLFLDYDTAGRLQIFAGSGAVSEVATGIFSNRFTLLGSSTQALHWGESYYIEIVYEIADSSGGSVQVYVNDDLWIDLSGVTTYWDGAASITPPEGWDEIVIGHLTSGSTALGGLFDGPIQWTYDDLYVVSAETGDADNARTTRMGDVAISWVPPAQDGDLAQWTPLAGGDHFAMVDEIPPDGDVTYNLGGSAPLVDTFVHAGLPVTGVDVLAVGAALMGRRVAGGPSSTRPILRVGTTNYPLGSGVGNTTTYTYQQGWTTRNPDTAADWTEAQAEAVQPGYEKTA